MAAFDLEETRRIVLSGLKGQRARVFLFGSWARGDNRRTSDIDVAVLPESPLPDGLLEDLRETLEESLVVYRVDLVDLSRTSVDFRDAVLAQGILWTA